MAANGIHHLGVAVEDLDEAISTYGCLFGAELEDRATQESWAAGLVVVVAPSGVGAREWVYVELLKGSIGHADLVAGALTLRVVTIVAELLVLIVAGRPPRPDDKSR